MGSQKNLIIAVVLSAGFLFIWSKYFMPAPTPPAPAAAENKSAGSAETATAASGVKASPTAASASAAAMEETIETGVARFVITSRGAGIKHLWLKEREIKDEESIEKTWFDLVNHPRSDDKKATVIGELPLEKLPLATFPELNFRKVEKVENAEGKKLVYAAQHPSGIEVKKEYLWKVDPEDPTLSYFIHLTLSFSNPGKTPLVLNPLKLGLGGGLGTLQREISENLQQTRALAYPSATKEVEKFKTADVPMTYNWAGIDNRYYLFAMLPNKDDFKKITAEKTKHNPGELYLISNEIVIAPKETKTVALQVYAGPKGYTKLKNLGYSLEHSVDFGFFGFLGKWALKSLYFLHNSIGNYGWAIIALTLILQVFVFPLTVKSYKSMAMMKKLQPKVQEIQKRYKEDPRRLQQEMINLYKNSGTSPFGGCIPMLLQLPIFWAFFTMLRNAYELLGSPWLLWIQDLSQKDPYYVLPIVMGGGMFLQQKISGSAGIDPTQAKIMAFMPIIFTFMFLQFPSGLVLYWLTNSVVTIFVQLWATKKYA